MKKIFKIDYEFVETIFKNSDKFWNQKNLKLHKCSEKTPNEPGAYIAYEQDDLLDQYLVTWDGNKWVHFESGSEIGFGSEYRDDHWSELPSNENPCSKIELPRYIKTFEVIISQLQNLTNHIQKLNPDFYHSKRETISENTELKFREFLVSINKDLNDLRFS